MENIFAEFPELITERLILRQIHESDVNSIFNIYGDEKVAEFDDFEPLSSVNSAYQAINIFKNEFILRERIRWGIVRKSDNNMIGSVWLGNFENTSKRCEVGYELAEEYWNNGYMTEVLNTILLFAFHQLKMNRIEAYVSAENFASLHVLRKLKFINEDCLRQREYYNNRYHDTVILSVLATDS